ncbi:S1C family serine protease [Candidatus Hecatella orcuttiae]|jgi:S1-C subfamily serine protease|uniref:S1C family serine protease n=1 Tax=Candidatus Hecatella orcuttiae TaxID=1935119 RepID=UPI002867BFFD|nr:trypsin-like peptidase domain-containing protein [Candidatus Hecatella orcuttiae]
MTVTWDEEKPPAEVAARPAKWVYLGVVLIAFAVVASGFSAYLYLNFQSQVEDFHSDYAALESQLSSLQSQVSSVEAELRRLRSQLEALQPQPAEAGALLTPQQVFKLAEPSVVLIRAESLTIFGVEVSEGSGFVYDSQGHLVTNNHVVEGADELEVVFPDGTVVEARLVGADPYSDLAVLKVDLPAEKLKPLPLGNSSELSVGDPIVAIGNPFGLSNTMTAGIVSQVGRELRAPRGYIIIDVIQVDAAINPGNSGGPLMNMKGEVVGVNTAIISGSGTSAGVGFAIPSDTVKREVPVLIATGEYKHPWIGISGTDVTPEIAEAMGLKEVKGFLITDVVEGSPAEAAGLRGGSRTVTIEGLEVKLGGDVIIGVDDVEVRKLRDGIVYIERNKQPGDEITLTIIREGQVLTVELMLGERPPP